MERTRKKRKGKRAASAKPFGDRLRTLRERAGMTQAQLAKALGVSPPRISEWERGVRTPKPLTQEAIVSRLKS